jgi:hypothetical protein
LKVLLKLFIATLGLGSVALAYLGISVNPGYLLGLLAALPGLWLARTLLKRLILDDLRRSVVRAWGRPQERDRDFERIGLLHRYEGAPPADSCTMLDDHTWQDLNLNEVFALVDRTWTRPGEAALYRVLRTPVLQAEIVSERRKIIRAVQEDSAFREGLTLELARLGRDREDDPLFPLWGALPAPTRWRHVYSLLALVGLASLVTPLIYGSALAVFIAPVFILNMWVRSRARRPIMAELRGLRPLRPLLQTARRLLPILERQSPAGYAPLHAAVSATQVIVRKLGWLSPPVFQQDLASMLYDYLDILLLLELRAFHSLVGLLTSRRDRLQLIYRTIGELDALQSVASYRVSVGRYSEPALGAADGPLEILDAAHPLLANPVTNSLKMHARGVVITGSNMSGKTTFARTVAVNAVLAQTIGTCIASAYRGPCFHIVTSLSEVDSLARGESYYLVQAKRLLTMMRASDQPVPVLCIIDELLNGTNSTERLAASSAILAYLAQLNTRTIVSTHDLELAERLASSFQCYHFSDQVGEAGLKFDYRIKEGISRTRNALSLLAQLGYPDEVLRLAREAIPA